MSLKDAEKDIQELTIVVKENFKEHDSDLKKVRETLHTIAGAQSGVLLLVQQAQDISDGLDEIKVDLRYHIKRTDDLQDIVIPIHKTWLFAKYSMIATTFIATVVGLLALLKVI